MRKQTIFNSFLLFIAAIIWGVAFVAQSAGMDYVGPLTFNASRFLIGGVILLPFAATAEVLKWKKTEELFVRKKQLKTTVFGGVFCGMAICIASILQQYGILHTTVGKAGFITALYIVMVPIAGVILKKQTISVIVAIIGLYLLCMKENTVIHAGDILLFGCAIVFTIHILVIDYYSPKANGVTLSCIQFLFSGVVCTILALVFEEPSIQGIVAGCVPILYAGVMSCGVAYTLQIIGQKNMNPTIASLILSLESVVSVLAGAVILHERLSLKEILGCILMFVAIVVVQLPNKKQGSIE